MSRQTLNICQDLVIQKGKIHQLLLLLILYLKDTPFIFSDLFHNSFLTDGIFILPKKNWKMLQKYLRTILKFRLISRQLRTLSDHHFPAARQNRRMHISILRRHKSAKNSELRIPWESWWGSLSPRSLLLLKAST